MPCLKCGRDLEQDGQVFCTGCLEAMAASPVKPGTVVLLPRRREERRPQPRRRQPLSPEEQVKRLRRRSRWQALVIWLLVVANAALGCIAYLHFTQEKEFLPGQNYSTMESAQP